MPSAIEEVQKAEEALRIAKENKDRIEAEAKKAQEEAENKRKELEGENNTGIW